MVHFLCALYEEAQFLIEAFRLKRNPAVHAFGLYEGGEDSCPQLRLAITGTGGVAAAAAVGYLAALDPPGEEQLLINVGSCCAGADFVLGEVLLGNKLREEGTGHCYYPDILYLHPFREVELVTSAVMVAPEKVQELDKWAFDMEAAAIYQAGSRFYRPDQMVFLKVVSDHGITPQSHLQYQQGSLNARMREAEGVLLPFLEALCKSQQKQEKASESEETERLKTELHCSVTMAAEVQQLVRYTGLAGIELSARLQEDREAGILPCKDKKEGKRYLVQLKKRVL